MYLILHIFITRDLTRSDLGGLSGPLFLLLQGFTTVDLIRRDIYIL